MVIKQSLLGVLLDRNTLSRIIGLGFVVFYIFFGALAEFYNLILLIIILVVGTLAIILTRYLDFFFMKIVVNETNLEIYKGVIFKSKRVIPYEKISTISQNRSLIHYFIGCRRTDIETNDVIENTRNIILTKEDNDKLRNIVNEKKNDIKVENEAKISEEITVNAIHSNEENRVICYLNIISVVKYTLINMLSLRFIGAILVIGTGIFGNVNDWFFQGDMVDETKLATTTLIVFIVIMFVIILIVRLVLDIFKYYEYKVVDFKDYYLITYGLINKQSFQVQKNYINGYILKQSIIQYLFKVQGVDIINAGYGSNADEKQNVRATFILMDKKENVKKLMADLFDTQFEKTYHSKYKRMIIDLVLSLVVLSIMGVILANWIPINIIVITILVLELIGFTTQYITTRNTSISANDKTINITNIMVDTKKEYYLKKQGLLVFTKKKNPVNSLLNLVNINVNNFNDNIFEANIHCSSFDDNDISELTRQYLNE